MTGGAAAQTVPPRYGPIAEDPHLKLTPRTKTEMARIARVVAPPRDFSKPEPFEARPGGAATSFATPGANAFSHPSANISAERRLQFFVGNGFFRKLWVSAPSSTIGSDGLGPLYNARACQRCHLKDGRGHPPEAPGARAVSFFMKVAAPAPKSAEIEALKASLTAYLDPKTPYFPYGPDPVYGGQIQDFAIPGGKPEARVVATYKEHTVQLSDGETATLRKPTYRLKDLGYGPLHPGAKLSPRIAPQMIGLGLLEAIPAADILAGADPDDADKDGVSGRPNVVWSAKYKRLMLGRFGLKAGAPTVRAQSVGAFAGDMGLSTPDRPAGYGECTKAQTWCRAAPHGGSKAHDGFEVGEEATALVVFYSRNLAPPTRRGLKSPAVLRGKEIFHAVGCASCHRPKFVTHRLKGQPEQSFQLIWPYTDMLLHDMGDGLADGFPEGVATGREWRTPPLWGIGLTKTVSGHTYFLHDGRARSLLEAVLWHGGEAKSARDAVVKMPKADRDALLKFLESL
ncbi:MAG: c-type cytochrome [Neomegalonema sp.]|nr:c-type cytochrome [Neomegalonema sp.]